MNVSENNVVSIIYNLKTEGSQEVIEAVKSDNPLTFIPGQGNLLKSFEKELMGLKTGDHFNFVLKYEDAYGPYQEDAVLDLPLSIFEQELENNPDLLMPGNVIPMRDQSGNRFNGKVIGVTNENVKMDFNHPMAGKNLCFEGEVIEIREATEEERLYGLDRGCGCSGGCGSDSCSSEGCGSEDCGNGSCGCGC